MGERQSSVWGRLLRLQATHKHTCITIFLHIKSSKKKYVCYIKQTPREKILKVDNIIFFSVFGIRWKSRRTCARFLPRELQNKNSLLNNHRLENIGPHHKKRSLIQGQRRSLSKTVGGVKSCLESNSLPTRDTQRPQTLWAPGPRDSTEAKPELCLSVSCKGMGQQWPAAGSDTECGDSAYLGPFEGCCLYLHYLHHSLASDQTERGEHSTTLQ